MKKLPFTLIAALLCVAALQAQTPPPRQDSLFNVAVTATFITIPLDQVPKYLGDNINATENTVLSPQKHTELVQAAYNGKLRLTGLVKVLCRSGDETKGQSTREILYASQLAPTASPQKPHPAGEVMRETGCVLTARALVDSTGMIDLTLLPEMTFLADKQVLKLSNGWFSRDAEIIVNPTFVVRRLTARFYLADRTHLLAGAFEGVTEDGVKDPKSLTVVLISAEIVPARAN